jgi:hypothetical protein
MRFGDWLILMVGVIFIALAVLYLSAVPADGANATFATKAGPISLSRNETLTSGLIFMIGGASLVGFSVVRLANLRR